MAHSGRRNAVSRLPRHPEEDRRKARVFFDRAKAVADTGNYDYAIEMYLSGLALDPEDIPAHQALREVSLKRKATGGKKAAWSMRGPSRDDKQNLLNAERSLAFDPGNTDHMVAIMQNAHRAGFFDTVMWIGPILIRANADSKRPEFSKFIVAKDIYRSLEKWQEATEAAQYALMLRPDDMELPTEIKNLGALHTMRSSGYESGKSFRESVKDMDKQKRLLEGDKDVLTEDVMTRMVREAEEEWKLEPEEPGKIFKLVDALARTEQLEHENRAIELLMEAHKRTGQFRYRHRLGQIKLTQLGRMERSLRAERDAHPDDAALKKDYQAFVRERLEEELKEYSLWSNAYPTDMAMRYQLAVRMFQLGQYEQAIPVFQQSRADPKWRTDAGVLLGRCFLEAKFVDEAIETLKALIDEYELKGDARSKEMYYWYGRALELRQDVASAVKSFSQVAQWDFNYRDVQDRIRRLRASAQQGG